MKKQGWMIVVVMMLCLVVVAACSTAATPTQAVGDASGTSDVAKPSNGGGPGQAVSLTGDATKGAQVYTENCVACHAADGKGGVANPGSTDGTIPALNPIDTSLKNADYKTFATNIDLFVEHGSKPEGDSPALQMKAFGDDKTLTPQQIADVIAYVISLNK